MAPEQSVVSEIIQKAMDKICMFQTTKNTPDSKVDRANMGPIWDRQDQGGLHVGSMNITIWDNKPRNCTHN